MEVTPPYALQGVRPNEEDLSDKQARILDFIQTFHAKNQRPPTNREIGRGVGIRSTSHVNYHLRILEEKGHIERIRNTSRGLRLTSPMQAESELRKVPLFGRIAAGAPIEAIHSEDELVPVPGDFAPGESYALKVRGQSMIDALIDDGDIVIVQPTATAENGDMVVAHLLDTRGANPEATLKRFYREKDKVRLQPANSQMQPIYVDPDRIEVKGKVVAVLRKL
ncbi:MAG TPA: transcriptional repressor LexA [Chloroflexota bacterium]|nr:transcriptional repressor LexA [Chloroflexota bacterium]